MTALLAGPRPPQGFDTDWLGLFETPCLTEFDLAGIHFCVNRHTVYMFVAALIVIGLFVAAASESRLVPHGVRNFVESIVEFVRNQIAVEVIGQEGRPWVPFLTSMFCFIFVANIFGLIPGIQLPLTSRIAVPAFMAGLVWFIYNAVAIKQQGFPGYLRNMLAPPGVPKLLIIIPLVPLIEFVSTVVVRPLTLTIRLFANMMAGHLLLSIFFLGTAYLLAKPTTIPFAVPAFALGVALIVFEILVAVLQAYIFTILTAVYIAGAVHPEH
jgi:F-type H+-transporting ATPase subunit a